MSEFVLSENIATYNILVTLPHVLMIISCLYTCNLWQRKPLLKLF